MMTSWHISILPAFGTTDLRVCLQCDNIPHSNFYFTHKLSDPLYG